MSKIVMKVIALLLSLMICMPLYSETTNELEQSFDYIENGLMDLAQEISNLENYIETLKQRISELNNSLLTSETLLEESNQRLDLQRRLLSNLYRQLDRSEKRLEQKISEYDRRIAKITKSHQDEVEGLEGEVLLWKIVAGIFAATAIGTGTYAVLK